MINQSAESSLQSNKSEHLKALDKNKKHFKMASKLFAQIEMVQQASGKKPKEEEAEFEGGEEDMSCLPPEWMLSMINHSLIEAHSKQMATYRALKEQFKDLKETIEYKDWQKD